MKYKIVAGLLSLIMITLIGIKLVDFTAFTIGAPTGTLYAPTLWEQIGNAVGSTLWSFRVIDVLIQAILLVAAVIGASAMFRSLKKEEA
ncbi:MAG: hypothetical protein K9W43_04920 [Candidatus Thorarchaeota archaeon]|nr:hypothetical protein [Candidatus Thorarchaeota archaeon]